MGWRYRRSVRIAPGIRLNASASGFSWTFGPRGASVSVGRRGTYVNAGIPGTGLYSRQRISGTGSARSQSAEGATSIIAVSGQVSEEGRLLLTYQNGKELDSSHYALVLKQHRASLVDLLEREATERNERVDGLARLHERIPDARKPPHYEPVSFTEEPPQKPIELPEKRYTLLDRLIKSWRARVDAENAQQREDHANAMARWQEQVAQHATQRKGHEAEQQRLRELFEVAVRTDTEAMERALEMRLQAIEWPRETQVSFDVQDGGALVLLDVDLPEVEDMPTHTHAVLKRGMVLTRKDLSEKRLRELYMHHIHGVGLRIAGEVFAALPACHRVVLSGYSQRPSKRTGQVENEYLYSARIGREQWMRLNFDELSQIDPVIAFDRFEARRNVTKTGVFTPVEPFTDDGR